MRRVSKRRRIQRLMVFEKFECEYDILSREDVASLHFTSFRSVAIN